MKLVIVESPSKAKTINKYLGKDFVVIASYGHVRQLLPKNNAIDTKNDFAPTWQDTIQGKKNLKIIAEKSKIASEIYLATDPDREGEAISWHIASFLKEKKIVKDIKKIKRVVFNSITKESILKAFENTRFIDEDLVSAYLARTSLDYLVGFNISPVLWRKLPGSMSAGRVQSVALRLICDRDEERSIFNSSEYWSLNGDMEFEKNKFKAKLYSIKNKKLDKFDIKNQEEATKIQKDLEINKFYVKKIEEKNVNRNPTPPFTTSSLQQEAFNKLGFSSKKTMQIAQKLYEGINIGNETTGLITYMRTDATQISPEGILALRSFIQKKYTNAYLNESVREYNTKARNAQEAHEAIRPTNFEISPAALSNRLDDDQLKLYTLIFNKTVASQMKSAIFAAKTVDIQTVDENYLLRANGSTLIFDGFLKVYGIEPNNGEDSSGEDSEEQNLPKNIKEMDNVNCEKVISKQHFTEPPPLFTEATLVKKLEELGIGRPSTYASIISVLQERNYCKIVKKRFVAEDRGLVLNQFLINFFGKYVEYSFTAKMESDLDAVSNGEIQWVKILNEFWDSFEKNVNEIKNLEINVVVDTITDKLAKRFIGENLTCPKCLKGNLKIKNSKFGIFVGCSLYPECNHIGQVLNSNSNDFNEENGDNMLTEDKEKLIGVDPVTNYDIFLKKGPYGYYLELQDKKIKRIAIPSNMQPSEINLEKASFLISMPRTIFEGVTLSIGKFGPYLKQGDAFYSVKEDIFTIDEIKAKEIIEKEKNKKNGVLIGVHPKTKENIVMKYGKYGPYLVYKNENYKIPKEHKDNLELDNAVLIIENNKK